MGLAEDLAAAFRLAGLAQWFQRRSQSSPERLALSFGKITWTYAALWDRVERMSAVLADGGVGAGDRVAYLGLNHPTFLVALFACARVGASFVPLNFRLTAYELKFIIQDADAHTLIADEQHSAKIDTIRADLACRRYLQLEVAMDGWENLATLTTGPRVVPPIHPTAANDTAIIMYTSGTTGNPKGAMLTHLNLWANIINWLVAVELNGTDIALNSAPLFHVGGLCIVVLPVLMAGGHVILHDSFDPERFLNCIGERRVTVTFVVPAMMIAISRRAEFDHMDLSCLRLMIAGGASVPEHLLRLYESRGIPVSQGWGMTETTTAVTFLAPEYAGRKLGSCGKAAMLSEFRICDYSRQPIDTPNTRGEICARGLNVMRGYWNRPEVTQDSFDAQGWFYSGDVGYVDTEGFLYICDRLKDMIISGGENVYPAEIESVLGAHPAIVEVAVVGAPDDVWGERVVAFAVVKPGETLYLEELAAFAGQRLARYKCPRELHLVEALPRNPAGKILKADLRRRISASGPSSRQGAS